MKERAKDALKVFLMLAFGLSVITFGYITKGEAGKMKEIPQSPPPPEPQFLDLPAKEGLKEALAYYDIQCPDIVYAQAILETGHFTSVGCVKHNNLFGLYNSRKGRYHKFNHWAESVVAYKEWIQRRYKPPEDYYKFLKRIGYASDPLYVNKLKSIIKYESERSKGAGVAKDTIVTRK